MDFMRYYIDGPGELLVVASDFVAATPDMYKIFASATCKRVSITGSADLEDITGGRSLFPQRRFQTGRKSTIEFEDCEMDFRYNTLVTGEAISVGAKTIAAFGTDYRFTIPSTVAYTVTLPDTPDAGSVTVRYIATGVVAAVAEVLSAGHPTLALKVLTFHADDKGKEIEVMYTYQSAATAMSTSLKIDSLPKTVKVIHKQPTYNNDNILIGTQYIEFFKMQPSSEFSEDYQERAAYSPAITFELVDPKRPDKKVFDRTFVPVAAS